MQELKHVSAATDWDIERDCTMCDSCKATVNAHYDKFSEAANEA